MKKLKFLLVAVVMVALIATSVVMLTACRNYFTVTWNTPTGVTITATVDGDAITSGDEVAQGSDVTFAFTAPSAGYRLRIVTTNINVVHTSAGTWVMENIVTNRSVTFTVESVPVTEVNRGALAAAITAAEGREENLYTPSSWTPFAAALATAQTVYANANATQPQINEQVTLLGNATNALVLRANRTYLVAAILDAQGRVQEDYLPASWTAFVAARTAIINGAIAVRDDLNATQQEVDYQIGEIERLTEILVEIFNETTFWFHITAPGFTNPRVSIFGGGIPYTGWLGWTPVRDGTTNWWSVTIFNITEDHYVNEVNMWNDPYVVFAGFPHRTQMLTRANIETADCGNYFFELLAFDNGAYAFQLRNIESKTDISAPLNHNLTLWVYTHDASGWDEMVGNMWGRGTEHHRNNPQWLAFRFTQYENTNWWSVTFTNHFEFLAIGGLSVWRAYPAYSIDGIQLRTPVIYPPAPSAWRNGEFFFELLPNNHGAYNYRLNPISDRDAIAETYAVNAIPEIVMGFGATGGAVISRAHSGREWTGAINAANREPIVAGSFVRLTATPIVGHRLNMVNNAVQWYFRDWTGVGFAPAWQVINAAMIEQWGFVISGTNLEFTMPALAPIADNPVLERQFRVQVVRDTALDTLVSGVREQRAPSTAFYENTTHTISGNNLDITVNPLATQIAVNFNRVAGLLGYNFRIVSGTTTLRAYEVRDRVDGEATIREFRRFGAAEDAPWSTTRPVLAAFVYDGYFGNDFYVVVGAALNRTLRLEFHGHNMSFAVVNINIEVYGMRNLTFNQPAGATVTAQVGENAITTGGMVENESDVVFNWTVAGEYLPHHQMRITVAGLDAVYVALSAGTWTLVDVTAHTAVEFFVETRILLSIDNEIEAEFPDFAFRIEARTFGGAVVGAPLVHGNRVPDAPRLYVVLLNYWMFDTICDIAFTVNGQQFFAQYMPGQGEPCPTCGESTPANPMCDNHVWGGVASGTHEVRININENWTALNMTIGLAEFDGFVADVWSFMAQPFETRNFRATTAEFGTINVTFEGAERVVFEVEGDNAIELELCHCSRIVLDEAFFDVLFDGDVDFADIVDATIFEDWNDGIVMVLTVYLENGDEIEFVFSEIERFLVAETRGWPQGNPPGGVFTSGNILINFGFDNDGNVINIVIVVADEYMYEADFSWMVGGAVRIERAFFERIGHADVETFDIVRTTTHADGWTNGFNLVITNTEGDTTTLAFVGGDGSDIPPPAPWDFVAVGDLLEWLYGDDDASFVSTGSLDIEVTLDVEDGYVDCYWCDGTGYTDCYMGPGCDSSCHRCSGTDILECMFCGGSGEVYSGLTHLVFDIDGDNFEFLVNPWDVSIQITREFLEALEIADYEDVTRVYFNVGVVSGTPTLIIAIYVGDDFDSQIELEFTGDFQPEQNYFTSEIFGVWSLEVSFSAEHGGHYIQWFNGLGFGDGISLIVGELFDIEIFEVQIDLVEFEISFPIAFFRAIGITETITDVFFYGMSGGFWLDIMLEDSSEISILFGEDDVTSNGPDFETLIFEGDLDDELVILAMHYDETFVFLVYCEIEGEIAFYGTWNEVIDGMFAFTFLNEDLFISFIDVPFTVAMVMGTVMECDITYEVTLVFQIVSEYMLDIFTIEFDLVGTV
ncbi:MAG: hypothetical protein FWC11_00725 [Firmicutes bacterium]|nr:hypothetical protein [Bacillota bacterium]